MSILTKIAHKIRTGVADFGRGIRIIFRGADDSGDVGDTTLARLSRIVMTQVDTFGVGVVRPRVIKSIEDDFKRAAKKGPESVESLIQNAIKTPDYMKLLHRLGMEEPHIRVMAMQAQKNVSQRTVASRRSSETK